ncbi:TPA: SMI1/KNR4 family protein [Klebsiella aerogenes]|nr:SMI1/KNR4 family protein [Klebsiella aerogenes]
MRLILEEQEKSLTQNDLFEFERIYRRPFPEGFKSFYIDNNGGYLPGNSNNPFLLGGFIAIKYGNVSAEKTYQGLTDGFSELKEMVPFAYDDGGNCFLLSLKDRDYGKIYIWLMDEKELAFVSESFDEFINELL